VLASKNETSELPQTDTTVIAPNKKRISPNCEITNTFRAAFIVATRKDQNRIKKNDTILIHSQINIKDIKSLEQKKIKASCENREDSVHISVAEISYSKYSPKKTKHNTRATTSIKKKNADIESKPKTIHIGV